MSRTTWQETIDQTQLVLQHQPDDCFVCAQPVPGVAPEALLRAYRDAGHQQRLAVVCGRRACRLALQDAANGRWQRLFDALTHWPDPAIYPHGPYWTIRRPHQLTFRTDPRRTIARDVQSVDDPDDATTLPVAEHRSSPPRPLGVTRRNPARRPWPNRSRR